MDKMGAEASSHLVPHQHEALSQASCWKQKSRQAFYLHLDQRELLQKSASLWTSVASGCRDNITLVLLTQRTSKVYLFKSRFLLLKLC